MINAKKIKIILLISFLAIGAYAINSYTKNYLNLSFIKSHAHMLHDLKNEYKILSAVLFYILYTLITALSIPAATLLTLTAGFLFGAYQGTLITVFAASTGALIIFLIARYAAGNSLQEKTRAHPQSKKILENIEKNSTIYLLFLRLVPLFPFWLVNIVPALTSIKTKTYFLATFFGIIPGTFIYVYFGHNLSEISNIKDLLSFEILAALCALGLFSLSPIFIKTFNKRVRKNAK